MNSQETQSIRQFDKWANSYDKKLHFPFLYSNQFVLNSINLKHTLVLLDVGCGTGILLNILAELNMDLRLYGIDISEQMIKVARNKNTNIKFCQSSSGYIPFQENMFDYVTCATSFHHYQSSNNALTEMYRVLKKNGTLIVLDPSTSGIIRKIMCNILKSIFDEQEVNFYTKSKLKEMFEKAGFKNIMQKPFLYYKILTIGNK